MQPSEPTAGLRKNLLDNETLQWVVEPDRISRLVERLTIGILGPASIGLVVGIPVYTWTQGGLLLGAFGFLAPVALQVGTALVDFWLGEIEYAATDQRLVDYSGRFRRTLSSAPFDAIRDVEYDISPVEHVFDVGTVIIDTDRGYETMTFRHVPNPERVAREVANLGTRRAEDREAAIDGEG